MMGFGTMFGKQRSVRRQLFPEKLWDLVNKPASGIQWSHDGKRIEVERTQLEKFIGTKFRSHNFDSFIRQLHFYGFRKCGSSYHHENFQKDHPENLCLMKRKYSGLPMTPIADLTPMIPRSTNVVNRYEPNSSILYDIRSNNDLKLDHPVSFSVTGKSNVRSVQKQDSIIFHLPDRSRNPLGKPGPKSLVLQKNHYGGQNFITAYFLFNANDYNQASKNPHEIRPHSMAE